MNLILVAQPIETMLSRYATYRIFFNSPRSLLVTLVNLSFYLFLNFLLTHQYHHALSTPLQRYP